MNVKEKRSFSRISMWEAIRGYLFILPAMALLLSLLFIPMVKGFGYSLTNFNILKSWDMEFIGLKNFGKVFSNKDFLTIIKNEVQFALSVTVVTVVISLMIALLLNKVRHCKNLVRSLVFMPWVLPEVVVGAIWRWMLNGEKGLVNTILVDYMHLIPNKIQFFSEALALISVSFVYIWRTYPYVTIMLSAGLQSIDREQYEASAIDGCNKIKQFWYVTLPNLRYVLSICSLMAMIWTMNAFGIINILTAGGPGVASTTMPMIIYRTAFQNYKFGLASAYSVVQFLIITIMAVAYLRVTKATNEEA
ncbi:MAG TPA: sugar ABC transporter permease [Clostridiales bacterium]|nr:sugar ABC transporter permease [Clostridiales bacterium]